MIYSADLLISRVIVMKVSFQIKLFISLVAFFSVLFALLGGYYYVDVGRQLYQEMSARAKIQAEDLSSFTLDYIFGERSRELYWEAFRRTDLIRFGKYSGNDYTWEFKNGTFPGSAVPKYRELFPIPASDIGANPNLTQNPGYDNAVSNQ